MSRVFTITLNPAIDQTIALDRLMPGAVHRAPGAQSEPGGKGVGVAAVMAALGWPVSAAGWLGDGNAAIFEAAFAQWGVEDLMVRVPGHTRTNIKLVDAARGDSTDINLPGIVLSAEARAEAERRLIDLLKARVQPGDWCELAGSLPPGAGVDVWERLAVVLVGLGAQLVFDVGGETLRHLLPRLQATRPPVVPVFIKPNRSELELLVGRALPSLKEVVDAAQSLCGPGLPQLVVSLGGEGAVVVTPQGRWLARSVRVRVATTVGAGDAMVAGTMAGFIDGLSFPDAVLRGMACAVARIQRVAPGLPPRGEVEALAAKIRLQAV
ncbi:MAG: hypothetical protein RLZZ618_3903 [Pseudomonadota bacterium]|jgi:1-phosphofructokinase